MNPYSDTKVLADLDRIYALRRGEHIVPMQFHFVLSDLCNHDCGFCSYRMSGHPSNALFSLDGKRNPNRMIPTDKVREILDDCAQMGVRGIQFTGGGEPTVHPDHIDLFRHALDRGLKCALVTNGNLLRDGWREVLPRFSWIRVSLDAGTANTYGEMRGISRGRYAITVLNIKAIADAIRKAGSDCTLGVSFVVTRENHLECLDAARRVQETGAAYIRFGAIFTPENAAYYDGIEDECRASVAAAKRCASASFAVHDQFTNRLHDLEQGHPTYQTCHYQRVTGYIAGDLNLYRCCNTAYNPVGYLGSLKDARLRDVWFSDELQRRMREFDARGCPRCHVNGKNQLLNAVVGVQTHPEFP